MQQDKLAGQANPEVAVKAAGANVVLVATAAASPASGDPVCPPAAAATTAGPPLVAADPAATVATAAAGSPSGGPVSPPAAAVTPAEPLPGDLVAIVEAAAIRQRRLETVKAQADTLRNNFIVLTLCGLATALAFLTALTVPSTPMWQALWLSGVLASLALAVIGGASAADGERWRETVQQLRHNLSAQVSDAYGLLDRAVTVSPARPDPVGTAKTLRISLPALTEEADEIVEVIDRLAERLRVVLRGLGGGVVGWVFGVGFGYLICLAIEAFSPFVIMPLLSIAGLVAGGYLARDRTFDALRADLERRAMVLTARDAEIDRLKERLSGLPAGTPADVREAFWGQIRVLAADNGASATPAAAPLLSLPAPKR